MILRENSRNDHVVSVMAVAPVYCVGYLGHDWSGSEGMLCSYSSLAHSDLCVTARILCKVSLMPHEEEKEQSCLWTAGERHSARQYPVKGGREEGLKLFTMDFFFPFKLNSRVSGFFFVLFFKTTLLFLSQI